MKQAKQIAKTALFYLVLAFFVVIIMLPFLWQFLTSIKPLDEISAMPAVWIPSEINVQYTSISSPIIPSRAICSTARSSLSPRRC